VEVGGVARQFVVQLEHTPGAVANPARALAARGMDAGRRRGGGRACIWALVATSIFCFDETTCACRPARD
jgi:hypothetical protein